MDALEIMSTIRNFTGLETENDIPTKVLTRAVNFGMSYVSQILLKLYHNYLVQTKTYSSQTGSYVDVPGDMLHMLDATRDGVLCVAIPVGEKSLIDNDNVNYEATARKPLVVHQGRRLYIYPTLSTMDVVVRYRKRQADLIYGNLTYASATTATLPSWASTSDDVYNGYDLAVYTVSDGTLQLAGVYQITDYVGSTKVVTLSGSTLTDVAMKCALVPIIPEEFHPFVIEAGMMTVKRMPRYRREDEVNSWGDDMASLKAAMKDVLETMIDIKEGV